MNYLHANILKFLKQSGTFSKKKINELIIIFGISYLYANIITCTIGSFLDVFFEKDAFIVEGYDSLKSVLKNMDLNNYDPALIDLLIYNFSLIVIEKNALIVEGYDSLKSVLKNMDLNNYDPAFIDLLIYNFSVIDIEKDSSICFEDICTTFFKTL